MDQKFEAIFNVARERKELFVSTHWLKYNLNSVSRWNSNILGRYENTQSSTCGSNWSSSVRKIGVFSPQIG